MNTPATYLERNPRQSRFGSNRWLVVLVAVPYFLAAELGHLISFPALFATVWFPAGVSLAVLLFVKPQRWPYVYAGTLLANVVSDAIVHGKALDISIAFWIANTIESLLAATIVRRICSPHPFTSIRNVLGFVSSACTLSTAVGALVGAAIVHLAYGTPYSDAWRIWWSADAIGMLVACPFIFNILTLALPCQLSSPDREKPWTRWHYAYLVGLIGLLAVVSHFIFGMQSERLAYVVYPILLWIVISFDLMGASTGLFVLSLVVVADTAAGYGLFGRIADLSGRASVLQIFLLVTSTTFLALAAVIHERGEASRQFLRTQRSLDSMADPVFWIKPDGQITYVNEEACRRLQYSQAELLSMNVVDINPDISSQQIFQTDYWPRFQEGKHELLQSRHQRKDGSIFPIEIATQLIIFQNERFLCSCVRDITVRLADQQKLLEAQTQLQLAVSGGNVGLWDWDVPGQRVYFSPQWHQQIGEAPETLRHIDEWHSRLHPDDFEYVQKRVTQYLNREIEQYKVEFRLRHADGSYRWVLSSGEATRNEQGEPLRFVGTHVEITQQKQIQDELKVSNQAQKDLVVELEHYARELERANNELEQFAYVASHDLKQPLRGIFNLATWINEDFGNQLPDEAREHLEKIQIRINRMDKLLDDLLAYSRVTRSKGLNEKIDVADLVSNIAELLDRPSGFSIRTVGTMVPIYGQRTPLEQVLRNLIGNAIKHRGSDQGQVEVSMKPDGDRVQITVADDGPGIEAQHHEQVFKMFRTLRPREEVEGSGMGLAIVKKLVTAHSGTIEIDPTHSPGAAFRFTWPLGREDGNENAKDVGNDSGNENRSNDTTGSNPPTGGSTN